MNFKENPPLVGKSNSNGQVSSLPRKEKEMAVKYQKEGSLKEKEIIVREYHFPLADEGWGNYYAHTFVLYKPKKCYYWRLEAGCLQNGWAIHGSYGYHPHGIIKLSPSEINISDNEPPEKMFNRLTKIALKKGLKICWE
jgi:hypothetical protein